jgi:hypothetical protein
MRRLRITVGGKQVETPTRVLSLKDAGSESRLIKNVDGRGINEIYRIINTKTIEEIDKDKNKLNDYGRKLRHIFEKVNREKELTYLVFSFDNRGFEYHAGSLPSSKEIDYLCNIVSNPYNEIIVPPRIPSISGENYIKFLEDFFLNLKSYNDSAPIMGFLPFVASHEFQQLIEFYFKKGVTAYLMDFEGNNPIDNYILVNLLRRASKRITKEFKEDTYLTALNVPFTRIKQKINVTPAKDIITFAMGFDSYASSHIPQKLPLKVILEIKKRKSATTTLNYRGSSSMASTSAIQFDEPGIFRIFDRRDYGYYRSDTANVSNIMNFEPTDNELNDLFNENYSENKLRSIRKAFNVQQQVQESVVLRSKILENSNMKYLETKSYARDNVKHVTRMMGLS